MTVMFFPYRYLIDVKWFKQWKKYVGWDHWDTSNIGEKSANPGPIENSGLFKGMSASGLWMFAPNKTSLLLLYQECKTILS